MSRLLILTLALIIAGSSTLSAQTQPQRHENGVAYLMDQVTERMSEEFNDIPVNVRRTAVYKINYSAMRFSPEEVDYIRGEVEYALRQYAGLTVLSPPELEPNDKMKIMGSDSTLQILNVRGRSLADVSPEFLTSITDKYGVQGLVELTIQRRYPEGLVLLIRMMNPNSREIVWTKSFVSNPKQVKEEVDKGRTSVIIIGAGNLKADTITEYDALGAGTDSTVNKSVLDLHASYTFRQPLNKQNSAYVGFSAGAHILKSSDTEEFSMTLVKFGVNYYQAITQKNEDINDYRIMFVFGGEVMFPLGTKRKGELFVATPELMFNLSNNLGLSIYGNVIFAGETLRQSNGNDLTFNKIGYGVRGVIRF